MTKTIDQRAHRQDAVLNQDALSRDIIVIGASAGGVAALMQLFAMLPADLPAAIGCVLHRGAEPGRLVEVLNRRSSLPVIEPRFGEKVRQGVIYLAPADHHLLIHKTGVEVQRGPKEHSTRPAVNPLFRSAAAAFGQRVVGALLTGCCEDGLSGMIAIRESHGLAVVQDPQEAYMPSMPLNAMRFDHVEAAFALEDLGSVFAALAKGDVVRTVRGRPSRVR